MKGRSKPARSEHRRDRVIDYGLLTLCGAGVLLTAYLTYVAWLGQHAAYCGAESACDVVQSSRWSTLLKLPLAFWGLLTYGLLALLIGKRRRKASVWRAAVLTAATGFAVSTYLTGVSIFAIGATCFYCLASYFLITAILVGVLLRKPPDSHLFPWGKSLQAPAAALVVVPLLMQLHYSGLFDPAAGPEKPTIQGLAMHLEETGAVFYGAYWCPRCQEQKALFEASVDRLPYVECAPAGPNDHRNAICTSNRIDRYPTWIINGQRHTGVLSLRELARYADYTPPQGPPEDLPAS